MSDKLNDVNRAILKFAGIEVDDEGLAFTCLEENRNPAILNGQRIALPTERHLRSPSKDKVIFHPLCESVLHGVSPMVDKLREVLAIRLNFSIGMIGRSLLSLAASPEYHSQLTPDQTAMVIACSDVDETCVKNFMTILMAAVKKKASVVFMKMYLNRGSPIASGRFARSGVVTFPFYEELLKPENEVYGVKVRVKDKVAYKALMEYMFPGIDEKDKYSRGSDSHLAPFLDALMQTGAAVASRVNDMVASFEKYIERPEFLVFDDTWSQYFHNLDALTPDVRRIPAQNGNIGKPSVVEKQKQPVPDLPQPPPPPPQQQHYQPPPQQYHPHQPPGYYPPPAYQPPPPPELRFTKEGLDPSCLTAVRPDLRLSTPMYPHPSAYAQPQREPSWARQQPQQYVDPYGRPPFDPPYTDTRYPAPYR